MGTYYGMDGAYQPGAVGATVISGVGSASQAIPNDNSGAKAKLVRLMVTGNLYVKFTKGAGTATTNDMLLSPNFDVVVNCKQYDTISYIQETAASKLNIIPLEA